MTEENFLVISKRIWNNFFAGNLTDFFNTIGALCVVCYASPIIIALVIPLIILFFFVQVLLKENKKLEMAGCTTC